MTRNLGVVVDVVCKKLSFKLTLEGAPMNDQSNSLHYPESCSEISEGFSYSIMHNSLMGLHDNNSSQRVFLVQENEMLC